MMGEVQLFAKENTRSFNYLVGMVLVGVLLSTLPVLAQLDTGSISGVVTDPMGSTIKDAAITARETGTGTIYRTTTSSSGNYVLPSIRTGTYELKVEAPGFKTAVFSGVVVTVASHMG